MRRSGEWRPRLRLASANSGGAGDPPAGHYDPAARNSLDWVERPLAARFKKSGPGSEIATVERREASVPIAKGRPTPRKRGLVAPRTRDRRLSALRSPSLRGGASWNSPDASRAAGTKGAVNMGRARLRASDEVDDLGEHKHSPYQLGRMLRGVHDELGLWQRCRHKACKRARRCRGDVDRLRPPLCRRQRMAGGRHEGLRAPDCRRRRRRNGPPRRVGPATVRRRPRRRSARPSDEARDGNRSKQTTGRRRRGAQSARDVLVRAPSAANGRDRPLAAVCGQGLPQGRPLPRRRRPMPGKYGRHRHHGCARRGGRAAPAPRRARRCGSPTGTCWRCWAARSRAPPRRANEIWASPGAAMIRAGCLTS